MTTGNDIKALVDNPESFLKVNNLKYIIPRGVSGKKLVELVPEGEKSYNLKLSERKSKNTLSAYVLGFNQNRANDALFLDIPSKGVDEGTFFFTAELSGCSVVVTRLNDNTYRVFHDYRANSAVLYDNVVMWVDWDLYKIPKVFLEMVREGHALACMQFRDGAWKLFVQRQYKGFSEGTNLEVEVHLDVRESAKTSLQTSFDDRRVIMQQSIKALAERLKIDPTFIDKVKDGTYAGSGKFDDNDPSIRGWKELRDAIRKKLEIYKQENRKLYKERNETAISPKAMDAVCQKHEDMLIASEDFDRIWLWLQIKKATGAKGNDSTGAKV